MLANMLNHTGDQGSGLDKKLLDLITAQLAVLGPQLGAWHIVWGPCVFQDQGVDKGPPHNVMYVAQDQAGSELVVGIAGTNANLQNWLEQNLNVINVVPWGAGGPLVLISRGAEIGRDTLLSMRPRATNPADGKSLIEFLEEWVGAAGKPVTVTIAGHSLGGTLSTVIGLRLQELKSTWDPGSQVTLKVWSSGGPTVGNALFADYYDRQLGATTTRFANNLDPFTYAWNTDDLSRMPTIYSSIGGPAAPAGIPALVWFLCGALMNHGYKHILANTPPQEGTLKGFGYFEEAMYQHGEGYLELMGVPELIPETVRRNGAATLAPSTETEVTLEAILKKAAEANAILEHRAAQVLRR